MISSAKRGRKDPFPPFFNGGKGDESRGNFAFREKGGGGVTDGSNLRNKMTYLPPKREEIWVSPPLLPFFSGLCFGVRRCETKNMKKYG